MLHYSTIEPDALVVLKRLMSITSLNMFNLVGGTALSLHYGHRLSIDLDLFTNESFDNLELAHTLERNFTGFTYRNTDNPIGLFGSIDGTKVDFVKNVKLPLLKPLIIEDDLRLLSPQDILAMKINAILKRGVKKDFWDIAELLNHFSVEYLIDAYILKYPSQQLLISIPFALTYFTDAEESPDPISLHGQTWGEVKSFIRGKVNEYLR